jgi:Ribbon-helix-helix domain
LNPPGLERPRAPVSSTSRGPSFVGQAVKAPKRIIVKRSVVVSGRQTSVTIEDQFWAGLTEIATELRIARTDPCDEH